MKRNMVNMVYERLESNENAYLSNVEIVTTLTGVDPVLFHEKIKEFNTVQRACENVGFYSKEVTKRQFQKLMLLAELLKRNTRTSLNKKIKVGSPTIIADLYMDEMKHLQQEHFDIAILDTKNQIIKKVNISKGTLNASIVHPRDVFSEALKYKANSIILIHNHPSGDPNPSREDISITNRLIDVGNIMGINVLDHIVIGDEKYISFKEMNLI